MSSAMTSDELRSKASSWLSQSLATDQRPVTFRELAREIRCHVHTAKNLLNDYLSTHPDVSPTFLVSGPLLADASLGHTNLSQQDAPTATQSLAHMSATQKVRIVNMDEMSDDGKSEVDPDEEVEQLEAGAEAIEEDVESQQKKHVDEAARWGVVLVGEDELSAKRRLFDHDATVHIYALTPVPVKDPALFLSSAFGLRKNAHYMHQAYGTIGGEVSTTQSKTTRDVAADSKPETSGKQAAPAKINPAPTIKESAKTTATKQEPEPVTKKEAEPVPLKPRKSQTKSKRRVIESDDEEEESPPAPAQRKTQLQQTSSMARADDQAAMEAMMAMDVDLNDDDDAVVSREPTPKAPTKVNTASKDGKKRKRRQVKKSRTEKDAKGYMVTKDYWTDESYSGSDTDTDSVPAKTAAPQKAAPSRSKEQSRTSSTASESKAGSSRPASGKGATKKAPMGQSTLAGFFKKK